MRSSYLSVIPIQIFHVLKVIFIISSSFYDLRYVALESVEPSPSNLFEGRSSSLLLCQANLWNVRHIFFFWHFVFFLSEFGNDFYCFYLQLASPVFFPLTVSRLRLSLSPCHGILTWPQLLTFSPCYRAHMSPERRSSSIAVFVVSFPVTA